MWDLTTQMSLFHFLLQMSQDGTGNDEDMPGPSGCQDPVVPDENMPHDDPGDDSPDLGEPEAVLLDRDRDLLAIKEEMTLTSVR